MALQAELPHNYHAIVQNADSEIDMSSVDKLYDQLHNGVFLNQKKEKFSVDKESGANSFELFAKGFSFHKGDWKWYEVDNVQVAEATCEQHFKIEAEFSMNCLTPKTPYEAAFKIKALTDGSATLKIVFPDGSYIEKQAKWKKNPHKWIKLVAGEFVTSSQPTGEMTVSMSGEGKIVCKEFTLHPKKEA